ncbi:MAG: DNA polymerase III subunit delta [Anaerolineae bacterium]|jgi:DNA polymerase-3 subunit delta|nr:DNA polymerase III subunit delta [Anaerolineae bacterium]
MSAAARFYLLYGDDDLALAEALAHLLAGVRDDPDAALNLDEFDGDEASVPAVLNAVKSFPFMAERRIVVVRGLVARLTRKGAGEADKKDLERLIEVIPTLPAWARLILVERDSLRKDSRLVKAATDHEFARCQAFIAPEDSTDWILRRARSHYQAEIDSQAAAALASVTGSDLRRADNELLKLVLYVNHSRPIQERDVALLTPYLAEASVFEMIDAIAAGRGKTALTLLSLALDQDLSDPGFGLFALITQQFRRLLLLRDHLDSGGSAAKNDVATLLNIKPYPAEKLLKQVRQFKLHDLEHIYRRLQQTDQAMKIGRIRPRLALELFVASVTT